MEDIYQYVENSQTAICLTNSAGTILDLLGDASFLLWLSQAGIAAGTILSEGEMGTNAIGLALIDRQPTRVVGAEHYLQQFHELAESAAPIFDLTGRPMGAIGILNLFYHHHTHTLGMAVAGAKAIEGQYQSDYLLAEQNSQLSQLNKIIEASTDGTFVIDREGLLIRVNEAGVKMVGIPRRELMGRKITDFIHYPGFVDEAISLRDPISDVEVTIGIGDRIISGILRLNYVMSKNEIQWVIATLREQNEVRELVRQQVGAHAPVRIEDIPGDSAELRRIHRFLKIAAPAKASILIRGEGGTGKNVLASAIHNASPRRDGPFLIVGCSSIPHEWVVGELLGYEDGFPGRKPGGRPSKFELAQGGTLFFQNIDDLPLEAQAILLNVLELGIVQRLGSERPIEADVRVIASSNANLEKLIAEGNFRAELYYRLSAFEITLPPLRERMEDLPFIAEQILSRLSSQLLQPIFLDEGVLELLQAYPWPGNIRELEAVLGRAAAFAGYSGRISIDLLPEVIQYPLNHYPSSEPVNVLPLRKVERETILQAAKICRGNVSQMAKLLGVGRTTIWRRLKEMEISLDEYRYVKTI